MSITVYTDGSADNMTRVGGYGFVVLTDGQEYYTGGGAEEDTTSNRMEMLAVIRAVEYIKNNLVFPDTQPIFVVSDSRYVVDGVTRWMRGWQRRNFRGVKNVDLWKDINSLTSETYVHIKWKKGHCENNYWNNVADEVANKFRNKLKEGYINDGLDTRRTSTGAIR